MNTTNIVRQSVGVALVSLLAGCAGWNGMSHQAKATTEGATGGAIVGAAVGGPVGAAVGAGVGGVVAHNNAPEVPTFHAPTPNRQASNTSNGSSNAMPSNEPSNANAATGSASNTNAIVDNNNVNNSNAQSGNEARNQSVVRDAQRALNDKGFSAGAVDGVMGPHTESALRQFQQAQGLDTTGTLDQQTESALGISQ